MYIAHKKTAPCELEGVCPTFGVQFIFQMAFFVFLISVSAIDIVSTQLSSFSH